MPTVLQQPSVHEENFIEIKIIAKMCRSLHTLTDFNAVKL